MIVPLSAKTLSDHALLYVTGVENLLVNVSGVRQRKKVLKPLYSYVECDSTSVFISEAALSSPTRHYLMSTFFCETYERKAGLHPENCFKIFKITKYNNSVNKTGI